MPRATEWFRNRIEARIVIEDWRAHYNYVSYCPMCLCH